jgi:hypothetical protein
MTELKVGTLIVSRSQVREMVLAAIAEQWDRDIADKVERSPLGHQQAMTDAVMTRIPSDDVLIHG